MPGWLDCCRFIWIGRLLARRAWTAFPRSAWERDETQMGKMFWFPRAAWEHRLGAPRQIKRDEAPLAEDLQKFLKGLSGSYALRGNEMKPRWARCSGSHALRGNIVLARRA